MKNVKTITIGNNWSRQWLYRNQLRDELLAMKTWTLFVVLAFVDSVANGHQKFFETNDYCYSICKGYKDMCMPEYLDPTYVFSPHCEDELNIEKRPSEWCIFCIRSHGLTPKTRRPTPAIPSKPKTTRRVTTKMPYPTPDPQAYPPQFPENYLDPEMNNPACEGSVLGCKFDKCLLKCGGTYERLCMPRWIDSKDKFTPHCEDTGNVGMPSKACILCLKINGVSTKLPPTTKTTPTTIVEPVDDPCRQRCLNYVGICLPAYIDPFHIFQPHCEDVDHAVRPPIQCLHCLKTFAVTPTSTGASFTRSTGHRPTTTSPTPCVGRDCDDDPCLAKCGNYNSMCIPAEMDPDNVFFPHCEQTRGVGMPTASCLACIKVNGVTSTTLFSTMKTGKMTSAMPLIEETEMTPGLESFENPTSPVIEAPELAQEPGSAPESGPDAMSETEPESLPEEEPEPPVAGE